MSEEGSSQLPTAVANPTSSHESTYVTDGELLRSFELNGVWSESSGELCMVGSGSKYSDQGESIQRTRSSHPQRTTLLLLCLICNYSSSFKGSIKSTRKKSDPLYFDRLELTPAPDYTGEEEQSIWKMDVEIILVVISRAVACVFGALQLFHVKRHPDVLPSISILMLLILALGYMIPLMLHCDAMFTQHSSETVMLQTLGSGWLQVNEVIFSVITMVGFLLQLRLLLSTMSARAENENRKVLWSLEKLALFVALPVYIAGSLVALLLINLRWDYIVEMLLGYQGHNNLDTFSKTCGGLVLDAFCCLKFCSTFSPNKRKRLCPSRSTLEQLLSCDIYLLYCVIIPYGGILFAGIIYLQQRFGGHCILPQNLRESVAYEKVPSVNSEVL
ncbi:hypothetical protein ACLB2K_032113 [Fragaria x ananassa]